jgi:2-keto-4-pentenoate hydratase
VSVDDPVTTGTRTLLVRRREQLARGAEPLGWKIGFNLAARQEKLGIDAPLAGFLTSDTLLESGATWPLGEQGQVIVESEVGVEIGPDGRRIVALLPALELADPPDLQLGVDTILAGNIFHRGVAFGPRAETDSPGAARILVNGEETAAISAEEAGARLTEMVEAAARRLDAAGEELRPGAVIITGVLAPPHTAEPGETLRMELEAAGGVELHFAP